ncbi:hypothetical protein VP14_237 [Vibrio phage VPMCC14]|nr:hypothetical protein VP14_237 [Vibrio phage VPMCC14]
MILQVWTNMEDYMLGAEAEEIEAEGIQESAVGGWSIDTEVEEFLFPSTCVIRVIKNVEE